MDPTEDSVSLSSRNEELLRLQGKDLDLNLRTDAGTSYFTITLTFRKTNQADALKGMGLLHDHFIAVSVPRYLNNQASL
jgi:hypothetical protein